MSGLPRIYLKHGDVILKALSLRRRAAPTGGPSRGSRPRRFPASGIPLLRDPMKNEKKVSICQGKLGKSTPVVQMKVAQRAGTHIVPALRSNWLPFYRPYSFASQPFDCFAENIQFSRSCTAVQPPFLRLPNCFFILSCLSSFVKILRPVFSVFADLFMPPGCCCFVPARFLPPRFLCPKSIRPDVSYV